jgi:hypothetical protein
MAGAAAITAVERAALAAEPPREAGAGADLLTVAGMAAAIYCLSVMLHEGLGHGGACLAVGDRPREWGAFYFDCDTRLGPAWKWRAVAAAGSTVNLIVAVIAGFALAITPRDRSTTRLALILTLAVNLFTWAGYFLFSGLTGLGDWGDGREAVLWRVEPGFAWRAGFAALGLVAYTAAIRLTGRLLGTVFGGVDGARREARRVTITAYLTGSTLSLLIGLLNPVGVFITLASAAASSFGGTAGFWSAPSALPLDGSRPAPRVERNWLWIVGGAAVAAAYAAVLGPSIKFR